jgi:Tol biopolymer transport system component
MNRRRISLALWVALLPGVAAAQQAAPSRVIGGGLPAVSPDGSRIAFVSNRDGTDDIYVVSSDGTGQKRLTNTPENKNGIAWTRDGKQILFSIYAGDTGRLYAIDLDGKNARQIAAVPGRTPTLSPDGKRLVYTAGTWTETELMVASGEGSDAKRIRLASPIAWNNHWSPDSKQLAFTGRGDPPKGLAIIVVNADGSEERRVTRLAPEDGRAQCPAWSPDGRKLAFFASLGDRDSATSHIWIADAATGAAAKVGDHARPYLDETPSWFPDGKRLAFQSNRTGVMEIWTMNADGSSPRQLTGLATADSRSPTTAAPHVP